MNRAESGQLIRSAAEVYDTFFVPALFEEWPPHLLDAAAVGSGDRVLDVACGTGVLARAAAERVGRRGSVTGLDRNGDMLAVAAGRTDAVGWRLGSAEALPFADGEFDAVVSQFGLMFFEDRPAAIREMLRVCRAGGRVAVAVWGRLEETPGYAAASALLARLFGDDVAEAIRAPYCLGDLNDLRREFERAGCAGHRIVTHTGTVRFPSIAAWMRTDIRGWTLADVIDDAQFSLLLDEAVRELRRFAADDGAVSFAAPAHIVTIEKD